jgi:hypothetical protein
MKRNFTLLSTGLLAFCLHAQDISDFESLNSCSGFSNCTYNSTLGWTPFGFNANSYFFRSVARLGTGTPGLSGCNGTNWFLNTVNPESWELSELGAADLSNTRYLTFQFTGNGSPAQMGITREIPWSPNERYVKFHIAGKIQSGSSVPTLMRASVGTFDVSGAPCTMYPGVTWTWAEPLQSYNVNTTAPQGVSWQMRSLYIPAGTTRLWIKLETTALTAGQVYRFYIDDVSWEEYIPGMAPEPETTEFNGRMLDERTPTVAPNPANGAFSVYTPNLAPGSPVQVFSADGRLVISAITNDAGRLDLDLQDEPAGLYSIRITAMDKDHVLRLMKE